VAKLKEGTMFRTLTAIAAVALAGIAAGTGEVSAGGGCHSEELTDERTTAVELVKNCFGPTVVRIDPGETVTWTSRDPEPHTVTGVTNSFGDYEELAEGDSVSHTFADSGVFPYFCVIHPSMVGAVVVGDGEPADPAAAAASGGDDGGLSAGSVAAIAAAVGLGGAALGLVGSRVLSSWRGEGAAV
jgi:plastocyanin